MTLNARSAKGSYAAQQRGLSDHAERRLTLAGRPVRLLPMEFRMLAELSTSAGWVLTYQDLLDRVWGKK